MSFLIFQEIVEDKRKTKIFYIKSSRSDADLGSIAYYNRWRKYVFYPSNDIIFDTSCLKEIIEFIEKMNMELHQVQPKSGEKT